MDALQAEPTWIPPRKRPVFTPPTPSTPAAPMPPPLPGDDEVMLGAGDCPECRTTCSGVCPTALLVSPIVVVEPESEAELEPEAKAEPKVREEMGSTEKEVEKTINEAVAQGAAEVEMAQGSVTDVKPPDDVNYLGVPDVGGNALAAQPAAAKSDKDEEGANAVVTPMGMEGVEEDAVKEEEMEEEALEGKEDDGLAAAVKEDQEWVETPRKGGGGGRQNTARNRARCTHCNARTKRWPGTLCADCGARWRRSGQPADAKKCTHCDTADTCRWLRGPDGPQTLCNACGKRWAKSGWLGYERVPAHLRVGGGGEAVAAPATPKPAAEPPQHKTPTCTHCGATESKMWRAGPAGRRTLCDECGVRWKRGEAPLARRAAPTRSLMESELDEDDNPDDLVSYTPTPRAKRRKVSGGGGPSSVTRTPAPAVAVAASSPPSPPPPPPPKSEGGSSGTTSGMRVRAVGMIEELEKASELLRFGLNSEAPDFEQLRAVNQFVIIGLRNLKTESNRLLQQ